MCSAKMLMVSVCNRTDPRTQSKSKTTTKIRTTEIVSNHCTTTKTTKLTVEEETTLNHFLP